MKGKRMAKGNIFIPMGRIIKAILEIINMKVQGILIQEKGNLFRGDSKKENQMAKEI